MEKLINKLAKRNKGILVLFLLTIIAYIISFSLFLKCILSLTGVETIIRYVSLIFFFLYFIIYVILSLFKILQRKYKSFVIISIVTIIFITGFFIGTYYINKFYTGISNISEKNKVLYTTYLIDLKNNKFDEESKIGIINDEKDIEGYILPQKIIQKNNLKNELVKYEDYLDMLHDLYEKKIDAIFLQGNYLTLYNNEENFENISTETKVIYEYSEKRINTDKNITSTKDFKEPLTFLILGVDSAATTLNANSAFNGDVLMLVTFNPKTLNTTMFSIPRDTYVPIACKKNAYARVNTSAAYGTNCVIKTIENMVDINIDYYVKINFKGVVDLVNVLKGVEVDVEKPDINTYKGQVCEQNSKREFGKKLICMNPGLQTLNGEQALAYSRNRHLYTQGDIDRNIHQQQVVTAIANKVAKIRNFNEFEQVLNAVTNNIATNMSSRQILSAYGVMKNMLNNKLSGKDLINIEKSYLEYYDLRVKLSSTREIAALGYYSDSLNDIITMMKINLDLEKPIIQKNFSFSVNENYIPYIAGKDKKKNKTTTLMPSFIGQTESSAKTFCSEKKLKCSFELVESDHKYFNSLIAKGLIGSQSVISQTLIGTFTNIIFYINNSSTKIEQPKQNDIEENDNSEEIDDITRSILGE